MPISDYINKHKAAGTLGKKTPTVNVSSLPSTPVKLTPSQVIARDKARGTTISSAPPQKVNPLRQLAQKLPLGFEKNVFDPIAKVVGMLAPSPTDLQKQIINENPNISNEALQEAIKKEVGKGGGLPLTGRDGLVTADTKILDMPDIAGLVKKVGGKIAGKGEQAVTKAVPKATPAAPKTFEVKSSNGTFVKITEQQLKNNEAMGFRYDPIQKIFVPEPGNRKPYTNEPDLDGFVNESARSQAQTVPKPKGKSPSEYMKASLATEPQPTGFDVRRSTQEELSNLETEKAVLDDFLRSDPAGKLVGKLGRGDNSIAQLQENAIKRGSKTTRYDDMTELGFADTDAAQSGVEAYRRSRERLNEINARIKEVRARDREAARLEKEELKSLEQFAGQTDLAVLPGRPTKLTPPRPPKKPPTRVAAGIAPEGKLPERRFLNRAKEMMPDNRPLDRIDGQYVPRDTDELAIKAKNLIKDDPDGAQSLLDGPINDRSVAVASELLKKLARDAEGAADNILKDSLYERAAKVANEMAEKLTEAGRTVQAASILGRLTPEGQLRFFSREIQKHNTKNPTRKIPGLNKDEAREVLEESRRIFDMPEGEAKIRAFAEFQKKMRTRIPSGLLEKISTIWRAGLLTGLKSTGLNVISNIVHGGAEVVKDVVATGADIMMSAITGKRTKSFTLKSLPKGIKEGFEKGWNYWKSGYDPRDISRNYEFNEVRFKSKIIQGYVDTVFRTLAATDQPLYYGALRRSLRDQAITKARNEGLSGSAMRKRAKELEDAPTEDMSIYSLLDAETAVFINRTQLGDAAKKLQDTFGGAGKFVIPFARTPSSVAMQVLNYSPVGIPIEVLKQIKAGKFDQRNLAQAIGRSVTGTVPLMWLGGELFNDERISLSFPETERERELWKAEGRTANSVKVGDKWLSLQVLGPLGPMILSGAYFKKAMEETGSPTEAMFAAMAGTLSSFFESTFLRGLDQFISAITDPARSASGFAASYVSSWIPTIINDIARATDSKERSTSADKLKDTIMNRIKSRLPGLRQSLEEQVDVLGADVNRLTGPGVRGGVSQMLNPTRPSVDRSTPITEELRRLTDAGFDASPTRLGVKKTGYTNLTPEQNTELWRRAGELTNQKLNGLFKLPQYQRASDEEKTKIIKKITTQAQERARARMVLDVTRGLSGQALLTKLSEAKASGLLTEPVLAEYKKLRNGTQ